MGTYNDLHPLISISLIPTIGLRSSPTTCNIFTPTYHDLPAISCQRYRSGRHTRGVVGAPCRGVTPPSNRFRIAMPTAGCLHSGPPSKCCQGKEAFSARHSYGRLWQSAPKNPPAILTATIVARQPIHHVASGLWHQGRCTAVHTYLWKRITLNITYN